MTNANRPKKIVMNKKRPKKEEEKLVLVILSNHKINSIERPWLLLEATLDKKMKKNATQQKKQQ